MSEKSNHSRGNEVIRFSGEEKILYGKRANEGDRNES